jgi:Zn-dependent peptidase ImmA (M78 family)
LSDVSSQAVARSVDTIRHMSACVRDALGYKEVAQINTTEMLEFRLPQILPTFVYDVKTMLKMGGNEGLASPDRDYIAIREDVWEGARLGNGRDAFTLAHEVGHLILHQSENLVQRRGRGEPAIFSQPEWQADTFAAELLMDARKIYPTDTPYIISRRFGVSKACAERRLRELRRRGFFTEHEPKRMLIRPGS